MKKKLKRALAITMVVLMLMALGLQAVHLGWPEREKQVRDQFQDWVRTAFPEQSRQLEERFGLAPYLPGQTRATKKNEVVILVHGLDEPGRVWLNLAPALSGQGVEVWFLTYPNDQAIQRSAEYFFLKLLSGAIGPDRSVSIVAHSMGGLVSRQMLTQDRIGYAKAAALGQVPRVRRLIMVGTPNHGAQLARFRIFMEFREQVQNLIYGQGHWLLPLVDGTGSAGMDLFPGSLFLQQLNARPHPQGVQMTVIAGAILSWPKGAATLGDGLVSLASARLEGIPLIQVSGNHLTMIRNLTGASTRVPPAVPMILKLLSGPP